MVKVKKISIKKTLNPFNKNHQIQKFIKELLKFIE